MNYSTVIVAAGSGSRMGLGYNKVYYPLNGKPILAHTMEVFLKDPDCTQVVVVTNPQMYAQYINIEDPRILVTAGGATRQESVTNGVSLAREEIVMIHDGARPYLEQDRLDALKDAMRTEKGACLMVPCKDTIKLTEDGYILRTEPREKLMAAQTPQVFRTSLIQACLEQAKQEGYTGTDDCSVVERYGNVRIRIVEGSYANIKITTPEDLQ